jgi:hypothetical protein
MHLYSPWSRTPSYKQIWRRRDSVGLRASFDGFVEAARLSEAPRPFLSRVHDDQTLPAPVSKKRRMSSEATPRFAVDGERRVRRPFAATLHPIAS